MDEKNSAGEDACQAFAEAIEKKDWPGAYSAYRDLHQIVDDEYGEGEEKTPGPDKGPALVLAFGKKK